MRIVKQEKEKHKILAAEKENMIADFRMLFESRGEKILCSRNDVFSFDNYDNNLLIFQFAKH